MQSLPTLPTVTKLSNTVTRVLGQNPGRYTLQGTNTYVLSHPSSTSLILLDTAQGLPSYPPHLLPLLTPSSRVQIILSHWHEDHVGGLSDVVRLLHEAGCPRPQVWKFAEGSEGGARDEEVERKLGGDVGEWVESAQAGQTLVQGGRIGRLREGQVMELRADEGSALALATLEVMHTPGHTSDSISLLLRSPSSPPALFTFDTVLGHGTAVFEDLGAYMLSLSKCLDMLSMADEGKVQLYPGHGEVVQDGVGKLKEYMKHRQEREDQVVGILSGQLGGEATAAGLCTTIYGTTIPESLTQAATRGLLLHLEKLEQEGKVERLPLGVVVEGEPMAGWNDRWRWSALAPGEGEGAANL